MSAEASGRLLARGVSAERAGRPVLFDVDFEADAGRVTAILGPNGAGKSTLLKVLAQLLPHEGEVSLDGRPLSSSSASERARRIAYVPQQSSLTAGLEVATVVAHGRYAHHGGLGQPGAADRRAIEGALERADVASLGSRRFDQLSAGEQRRVLLARALATEARVILLDEPTSSLDIRHALELHALLRALASDGFTLVVVLHELDAARRWTDRATLLREGRVAVAGDSRDVIAEGPVREVYGVMMRANASLGFSLEDEA